MKTKIFVYIIALIFTLCTLYALIATENELYAAQQHNATLQTTVDKLTAQNKALQLENAELNELSAAVDEFLKMADEQDKADRGGERLTSLGEWKVTGYCKCRICCGKWADNRPNGKVIVNGIELIEGVSCAADLPIGTRLMIGGKVWVVHDRPAERIIKANGGKVVDLYCGSHDEAWDVGNSEVEVWEVE